MIYEGGPKVHWEGAERTDFQRDRTRLQWSTPQPHGLCDFQPSAKMIELFCNFFPGQQWCHHVCFSSSVHGQTRADCLWEVWICPPFLLKVAFHLASCMIESSITNWTSTKKGETTWQIGWSPHCARPSDLSIPRRLGGGTFARCWRRHDICKQKKLCHRSFGAKKSGEKV